MLSKTLLLFESLRKLQKEGRGEERVCIASTNSPWHYEKEIYPVIGDEMWSPMNRGVYWFSRFKKVYDYPYITVNEAVKDFWKYFGWGI